MKLFIAVVLAACSFAVHAENGEFLLAKNKFDFKNAINQRDVYVKHAQNYTENLFHDALQYLNATFDEIAEVENRTESDLSGFAEMVKIELDGSVKLAESRLEKLAEKDDVGKECAEKYNAELEDALVNGRKELGECIANAIRQGRDIVEAIRPAGREIVRLINEVKALVEKCWSSTDNLYEAVKCVFAKGNEINEKLKTVWNIYKEIYATVQEKAVAIIAEGRKCIGGVALNTSNKLQEIVKKVEQCIAAGQNSSTTSTRGPLFITKLFIAAVLTACSFAVNADNGDFLPAKNKFDFKDTDNQHDGYLKHMKKYSENLFEDARQYFDARINEIAEVTHKTESFLAGFMEMVQIESDDSLKLAETCLEKLAEKGNLEKECVEKYNAEFEAVVENVRKGLGECIANAVQQGREISEEIRPQGEKIVLIINEIKESIEKCLRSNENLYEVLQYVSGKAYVIEAKLRVMWDIYKQIISTVHERTLDVIRIARDCIGTVLSDSDNKVQAIMRKVEQCINAGPNPSTSSSPARPSSTSSQGPVF